VIVVQGVSIRNAELADLIIEQITEGKPLRQICREQGVSKTAIYDWLDDDPELNGRFARARERGGHEIADECLEIADDREEDPASRRVMIETRLKLLAKWNPRQYGDKMTTEHTNRDGEALRLEHTVITPENLREITDALLGRPGGAQ
jgi:hypothetical protein